MRLGSWSTTQVLPSRRARAMEGYGPWPGRAAAAASNRAPPLASEGERAWRAWPLQVWLADGGFGPRPLRAWRDAWHWPLRGLRTETTRMHWMAVGGTNLPRVTVLPVG